MSLPALLPNGYLPPGVHEATRSEIVECFGVNTPRCQVLANRLQELVSLARATGKLRRIFIWGSFVTDKPFPRDLDIFLRGIKNVGVQRCLYVLIQCRLE